MKINVIDIVVAHAKSMASASTLIAQIVDIFIIFVLPVIIGIASSGLIKALDQSFYGVSVSVFAVFAALLLNTQIAIFGIYGRTPPPPSNEKETAAFKARLKMRNSLIAELNVNVSYLMIFAVVALFLCGIFYIFDFGSNFETILAVSIYSHFSITMIVVIKRSHALFAYEYGTG